MVNNITVQNCNLDNNSADLRGGGINIAGDGCTVENVSVSNNRAGTLGGGIFVNSNGTTFTNITADNNTAQRGGAAFINGTNIIVRNGELNNNKAINNGTNNTGLGGAFDIVGNNILVDGITSNNNTAYLGGSTFIRGSNVTVKNSNLDNNSAELRGGALNIGGGIGSQIINVSASNNEAGTLGGAVYVEGDKALFDNVTSIHNTAVEGGSSYIAGNEVIVRNCNLDNNSATDNGGGLYVSGNNCTFENVALSNCNASEKGGAVYVEGNNDVFDNVTSIHNTAYHGGSSYINGNNTTIMNCNLDNNIAYTGGGVYVDGNDAKFVNVSLSNCIAEDEGGAVYIAGNSTSLNNVTSKNNTAFYGGSTSINGYNTTVVNSEFIDNHANGGGAIYVSGDNATFTNNDILYNDAEMGGGIFISGHSSEFSDNQISYNDANFGGAIAIDGSSSEFTNNNITFNKATSIGGAVYISGYVDEITNFTGNNISSNHADIAGGAIYSDGEDLNLDQIYAYNNTALKAGFADIISADNLVVKNSTFISNRALGNINDDPGYYGTSGIGGAFIVSTTANATIQGNFYNNTAEFGNGSAIYVEDSTLKVYDTRLFDNLAHSWALPISPKKGTAYRLGEQIIVEIWHIGGDNIANGIHSMDGNNQQITINNITYQYYNHGVRVNRTTNATDQTPVIGWGNSSDGDKIYLDDLEDNQNITYEIIKLGDGAEPDPYDITDIQGSIRLDLTGRPVGRYQINAYYPRSTYYTEISNTTWIIIYDVTEINVTKVWDDYDDYDGIRPINVTVQLYNNDTGALINQTVLYEGNNWTYVFSELNITDEHDNVINYTIREVAIDGYTAVFTVNNETNSTIYVNITNVHVPMTSVNVTKYWDDGNNAWGTRPDNITVYLLADGTRIDNATLNRSNNWYHSFENLTVFNGTEKINYTIEEDNVTVNMTNVPAGVISVEYVSVIRNSTAYNWTINNTLVTVVDVTKIWIDGNNTDNTRPENITVNLLADGQPINSAVLNETNNWYHAFTNLTVFNGNNEEIAYRIEEVNVTGYISVNSNSTPYNWTVVNTLITEVNVTKIWIDGNNATGDRPANITVILYADGQPINSTVLNETNNWTHTFVNLTKYHVNGTAIKYNISEVNVTGYISVNSNNTAYNFTIVNTQLVNFTVEKVWIDGNNVTGARPGNVTVILLADGQQLNTTVLNVANNWNYTFVNLTRYHANGTAIVYSIDEIAVPGYSVANDYNGTAYVWTVTNTELVNFTVDKVWIDGENATGARPGNVTVYLLADGSVVNFTDLNVANNWNFTFVNLTRFHVNGSEIKYSIAELGIAGYNVTVTNSTAHIWTVTNTELNDFTVEKVWIDGNNATGARPGNVTVILLADGLEFNRTVLNVTNNWRHTFVNLTRFDNTGRRINYTVAELTVPGYSVVYDNSTAYLVTVTNTELVNFTVVKVWNDDNNATGNRPVNVTINLMNGTVIVASITLNESNSWNYTFVDLLRYDAAGFSVEYDNSTAYLVTVTNTELVNFTVVKVWNDGNNATGNRPGSIAVVLLADGNPLNTTTLSVANSWNYTFVNLTRYHANGSAIVYSIAEIAVPGYSVNNSYNGTAYVWTVTNTELVNLTVEKVWTDNGNQDGVRPESVTVNLVVNQTVIGTVVLNDTNNWTHTFYNLDMYANNGTLIAYDVNETFVANYNVDITRNKYEFIINNTHVPELVNVTVEKVWNDSEDRDGFRPVNITVNLVNETGVVRSAVVVGPNWNYTFENLPKYRNGTLIVYNVTEDPVANYNLTYINGTGYIFTITNVRIVENVTVNVTKVWNDNDNQDGVRPFNITVNLVNQYGYVGSVLVTAPDWNYTFENLPKYRNGELIVYNVTEGPVANYSVIYSNGSAYIFTITNTHVTELINITVEKVWTDNDNQDGVRPENVTVNLIRNQTIIRVTVLNDTNNWTFTFLDLDKYENNGTLINYTVNENNVANYTVNITRNNNEYKFIINNTHIPELVNVTVEKVWNDVIRMVSELIM